MHFVLIGRSHGQLGRFAAHSVQTRLHNTSIMNTGLQSRTLPADLSIMTAINQLTILLPKPLMLIANNWLGYSFTKQEALL